MFEIRFHAWDLSETTVRGFDSPETAMCSGKLRLRNQESGRIAVIEEGGSPEHIMVATKRAWKWTRDL